MVLRAGSSSSNCTGRLLDDDGPIADPAARDDVADADLDHVAAA